ncbi:MAG TPA: ATP-dependent DNA ligase [Candidatus Dormibacteraeota bacterium]|nr:ATP-dependent DNA ligase [Candidatus Dormibacteraeota bacterium]
MSNLPFGPPITPMLARGQPAIPRGEGWIYEPKWDGFRAVIFVDGEDTYICSRNGQPLQRYFPELLPVISRAFRHPCIVDGEIIIASARGLDFDALQMRIHPAESRVRKLAEEIPASIVLFDLLADGDKDLRTDPFSKRRAALTRALKPQPQARLTPQTIDPEEAVSWFDRYEGAGCDGVVAKRADQVYAPGERTMIKVKHLRTVDCVVGGYREYAAGPGIGSLLLGLYDEAGVLHHVGHTSSFSAAERREVLAKLQPLVGGDSFGHGRTPGSPSRWSGAKDLSWVQVRPELVCEVNFEKLQGDRFRHAARFLRWRTDKDPGDCDFAQLEAPTSFSLDDILEPV